MGRELGHRRRERIRERSSGGRRKKGNGLGRVGGGNGVSEMWSCSTEGNKVVEGASGVSEESDMRKCNIEFRYIKERD